MRRLRGRDQEWSHVLALLEAAEQGRSGVLIVEGREGTGKSRFLAEAVNVARDRGFTFTVGSAEGRGRLLGPTPALSLPAATARSQTGDDAPRDGDDRRMWLVEQLGFVEQLRALLDAHSGQGPLLVAVDDLQLADPAMLLAMRVLPRWLVSAPLVWVLARRSSEGGPALDGVSAMLERDGALRLELGPLADEAVAEVVADALSAEPEPELLALAREAGGNPRLVVELVEGLRDEGALELAGGRAKLLSAELPQRVRTAMLNRLAGLCPETRHVLEVAALLGDSFSVDAAAEALVQPATRLVPAFREAVAAGVLVSTGEHLAFGSELCRRVVADAIPEAVRRALHRQLGHGPLTRAPSRELVPASTRSDLERTVARVEVMDPSDADRISDVLNAVETAAADGRLSEAAALARAALAEQPPPSLAARLRCALSAILLKAGRASSALMAAEAALEEVGLPDDVRVEAEMAQLWALAALGDLSRAGEKAKAVLANGESLGDASLASAKTVLSLVAWSEGRLTEGLDLVRSAVDHASREPSRRSGPVPSRCSLAARLAEVGRFDEAGRIIPAAGEEHDMFGDKVQAASAAIVRSHIDLDAGRLDPAVAAAEAAGATAHELGAHLLTPDARGVLATAALRRGELAAAADHLRRARAHLATDPITFGSARHTWVEAQLADAEHGPARAFELLAGTYDGLAARPGLLVEDPAAAAWMVRTALAVGDQARAAAVVAAISRLAGANPGFPTVAAAADHARGLLSRDPAVLIRAAGRHRHPWARGSAAEDAGVVLSERDDREGAQAQFDQAMAAYQEAGAERDVSRVRSRLRQLGVRRRHWRNVPRPVYGWESLTDTERNVAGLVAEGLTNRQAAARMFLSPHTIDFHLRQIYRKLGITSRVELTRIVLEREDEERGDQGVESRGLARAAI